MAAATTIPTMMDDPTFATTKYVFTIHTPSRGAMDKIPLDWFDRLAINSKYRDQYIDENMIDPTLGCLRLAHGRTAVSKEHGEVSRKMFPGIPIEGIMNGTSWEYFLSNFLRKHPDPNPHQLYMAHQSDRRELIALVQELSGAALDPDLPIIGAVRRLDVYKNQLPMLQDHIAAICADRGEQVGELRGLGANVLIGGVAHENNSICKDWMRIFEEWNKNPQLKGRFIYIPSYSSSLRWKAAAGSDIWVEMPWEEWEACGTSTMVAKINGNLNIATKGGGIAEHGTEFDSETGTGDTLFIDPYGADTMFAKLTKACDWYYRFRDHGDGPWPDLRMNNYRGGEPLDVTHMIERYQERVFDSLLGKEAATTGA
jgi:starch phosphorylase